MSVKKFLFSFIFILSALASAAQTFPETPDHLVNDYTNTLTADQVAQLEQKLVAFNDSTSTQIAVVIIRSLEGYDVSDYAVRLAEKWGIGGKENNNGVLLLVSLGDRKVTIQTGYGVEGALPDAIARRIISNEITPNFKNGNYFQGIDQGTNAIISYTRGEYKNTEPKQKGGKNNTGFIVFIVIMIVIFIIRKGGGGGNQVIGGRGAASPFWWMLMGSALGGGGRRDGGGFGGFSGGGGGGFGGFGGGSFGGGGASGDW